MFNFAPGEDSEGLDYQFSLVKKIVLAASVVLVAFGGAVHGLAGGSHEPTELAQGELLDPAAAPGASGRSFTTGDGSLVAGEGEFFPDPDGGNSPDGGVGSTENNMQGENAQPWSPALFRGGVGLFLGFAMGFVLRLFVRMVAIVVGVQLLALFVFSYLGWVEVHWGAIDTHVKGWFTSWGSEFNSFRSFVTGHLPSTVLATLGTWVGWRRS